MENFQRPTPLPDWKHCPNCNEQYGKVAMVPHVVRCKKLFPDGRNGFLAEGGGDGGSSKQGMSSEEAAAALARAAQHSSGSPCGHPPLQKPTRLLGATLWARKERPRCLKAEERLLYGLRSGAGPKLPISHHPHRTVQ